LTATSLPFLLLPVFFALAIVWQWRARLHQKEGVRFRARITYSLFVSTAFLLIFLLDSSLRPADLTLTLLACAVLTPLYLLYSVRRLQKGLQGAMMRYTRRPRWHYVVGALIIPLLLHFAVQPDEIRRYSWFIVGGVFAWWSLSIFELVYVLRLEHRLGTPIIEQHQV
jgi:cobalamin synthase